MRVENHCSSTCAKNRSPTETRPSGGKRPRINACEVKSQVITPAQVRKLLEIPNPDTLKEAWGRTILHILFYTGCRISEISSLKVRDFYEDGGYWGLDFVVKSGKRNKPAIH